MSEPTIIVTSSEVPPGRPMPWVPSGDWPLLEEDGSTAVHWQNIGPEYDRKRRRAITKAAKEAHLADVAKKRAGEKAWIYGLRVHRAVAAGREEREFYRVVFLSDEDRGLVFYQGIPDHPATFREIAERIGGIMARRQARRALRSLVSRGVVRSESRRLANGKTARFYTHDLTNLDRDGGRNTVPSEAENVD